MAKRTVNVAVFAYKGKDGESRYGTMGEEVEVHDDFLDRFDSLNGEPDEGYGDPIPDGGPDPLDHGAGEASALEEPSRRDGVDAWRAYAAQEGVEDVDSKSKRELMSELAPDDEGE